MGKVVFYDTSALLALTDAEFSNKDFSFLCSSITLSELDDIKDNPRKDERIRRKARKVINYLCENEDRYSVIIVTAHIQEMVPRYGLPITNDNLILACACEAGSDIVYSEDLMMRQVGSQVFGLNMKPVHQKDSGIYTGYRTLAGGENAFNHYMDRINMANRYTNEYLIWRNTATDSSIEMRFDGKDYVQLRLPPSNVVKGKTPQQRCALDMLMNDKITIVALLGGYGSGKTYLATQMALYNATARGKQSKVLGVREPRGEGRDVGFLPGTFNEKVQNFFTPIAQQISGGQYMLEDYMRRGVLETNIPFYMKGTTYNDTIIVVDEAEDLTEQQLRLIGTRLGENSRIFLAGDYGQSLLDKTTHNPLVRMCNQLKGNEKFACIYLDEDVRSETSKIFSHLFK